MVVQVKLRQRRAEEEERKMAQEERYASLQEEADSKTRKLKQLWSKVDRRRGSQPP